jgi:mono/diheme cytochrome c family protein
VRIKIGKIFQWIGILLIALLGLVILAVLALYVTTNQKLNKTYEVSFEMFEIPRDAETIERGRRIVTTRGGCYDCHGGNFAGQVFDEGLLAGRLSVPNLTPGKGGVGAVFKDEDWVRAIRYGLDTDGTSLVGMPSEYYNALNDADLAAIIAYLRSLEPVDTDHPPLRLGPLFRWYILTEPHALPASLIDHDAPRPPAPVPGVTAEYGKYLAIICSLCHGDNLAGGTQPGAGLNLTPGGDLANWTEEQFIHSLRTGETPAGKKLDSELMPWKSIGQMSDDELKAVWLYLKSLPPVENLAPTPTPP